MENKIQKILWDVNPCYFPTILNFALEPQMLFLFTGALKLGDCLNFLSSLKYMSFR